MPTLPSNPSKSVRDRNPHLFSVPAPSVLTTGIKPAKRIRQNTKPLMNKLETAFLADHCEDYHPHRLFAQAITFRLANGLRYTPDFFCFEKMIAWEVKGKWVDGDSFPKLKMAASVYPEIRWILAWKESGQWLQQEVLP